MAERRVYSRRGKVHVCIGGKTYIAPRGTEIKNGMKVSVIVGDEHALVEKEKWDVGNIEPRRKNRHKDAEMKHENPEIRSVHYGDIACHTGFAPLIILLRHRGCISEKARLDNIGEALAAAKAYLIRNNISDCSSWTADVLREKNWSRVGIIKCSDESPQSVHFLPTLKMEA